MKLVNYYEDISKPHVNTLPDRAYFIPFADSPVGRLREESDRMQLLNGSWKFELYPNPAAVPEGFYASDYDPSELGNIDVPGCWQNQGYDKHQFEGDRLVIPATPPYVPFDNPCGTYITDFEYEENDQLPITELVFEGVDSCMYVWVNGAFVGYSEVSHAISMFDISSNIRPGKNRLAVLNMKWSTGTYFEVQFKWRQSGIFRDVYLLKRPKVHLQDFFIREEIAEDYSEAKINTEIQISDSGGMVNAVLFDPQGKEVASQNVEIKQSGIVLFTVNNPKLWSAELPELYTMVIALPDEKIAQKVGIRRFSTEDGMIRVNGYPIRFKGVNRNDTNPYTGYTVSREDIELDLRLMKQNNINAVRTAHFPNSPLVIELCNEYGLYVISEADYETHGLAKMAGLNVPAPAGDKTPLGATGYRYYNPLINDDPEYETAGLDRMKKNPIRDKNQPSVIMWSLGNESGWGRNHELAGAWIKKYDPSRLLIYENLYPGFGRKPDYSCLDALSNMYPSTLLLQKRYGEIDGDPEELGCMISDEDTEAYYDAFMKEHPYFLVEYSIAMGNGAGDMEDYFQIMERNKRFAGGFIWEWADQSQCRGEERSGKPMFQYGGDYGDEPNSGSFCLVGLNSSDRKPHTSLKEYKNIIRPVRARWGKKNETLLLKNMLNIADIKDEIDIHYELTVNGIITETGKIDTPSCAPGSEAELSFPSEIPSEGVCYLRLIYHNRMEKKFMPAGFELGFDQLELDTEKPSVNPWLIPEQAIRPLAVHETDNVIVIGGYSSRGEFEYTYDRRRGLFRYIRVNNRQLLDRPMEFNLARAPIDNDIGFAAPEDTVYGRWVMAGYYDMQSRVYRHNAEWEGEDFIITGQVGLAAVSRANALMLETKWRISPDGMITLTCDAKRRPEFPYLPRFGIRMFLKNKAKRVRYFGLGPNESYVDKNKSSYMHLFDTDVDGLFEDYVRPQENGSHCSVKYLNVGEDDGYGIQAVTDEKTFSFNVSKYTHEMLTKCRHNYELIPSQSMVVCLDYMQSGIGSAACGPPLLEKYRLNDTKFTFHISILPRC